MSKHKTRTLLFQIYSKEIFKNKILILLPISILHFNSVAFEKQPPFVSSQSSDRKQKCAKSNALENNAISKYKNSTADYIPLEAIKHSHIGLIAGDVDIPSFFSQA